MVSMAIDLRFDSMKVRVPLMDADDFLPLPSGRGSHTRCHDLEPTRLQQFCHEEHRGAALPHVSRTIVMTATGNIILLRH